MNILRISEYFVILGYYLINSTMKFRLLIFLIFQIVISNIVSSQIQSLVIDTNQSNLQITKIYDTLWNSPPYQYMSLGIDVNNDNTNDLIVSCDGYQGSSGDESEMWLEGDVNTEYVLDTLVIDSIEYYGLPGNNYVVDTFQIAFKFTYGDTLRLSDHYTPGKYYMVHCFNYPPGMTGPGVRLYLNDWVGGDNYVGFKTILNNVEYLGWLKVEVKFSTVIIVKECAIYDPELSVIENNSKKPLIYPNPASGYFQIDASGHNFIEVFSITGIKVLESPLTKLSSKSFSCEFLKPGLYIVRLSTNQKSSGNEFITQKLVVQ